MTVENAFVTVLDASQEHNASVRGISLTVVGLDVELADEE